MRLESRYHTAVAIAAEIVVVVVDWLLEVLVETRVRGSHAVCERAR